MKNDLCQIQDFNVSYNNYISMEFGLILQVFKTLKQGTNMQPSMFKRAVCIRKL